MIRRFVLVGQKAEASDVFLLDDIPGTSGRLDILARAMRAAFLSSHGLRHEVILYLILLGGERAPRTVRFVGRDVKFLRPDERACAVLLKKVLASRADDETSGFVEVKPGIALARGSLEVVLADADQASRYVLRETGDDIRTVEAFEEDVLLLIGDHVGIPDAFLSQMNGARDLSLGPVSIHADDAVAVVQNELDRRTQR